MAHWTRSSRASQAAHTAPEGGPQRSGREAVQVLAEFAPAGRWETHSPGEELGYGSGTLLRRSRAGADHAEAGDSFFVQPAWSTTGKTTGKGRQSAGDLCRREGQADRHALK